ncbi:SMODS domain-containing nucleotidyltransferase [Brevundimonas sp. Root1279]|uniref:SMODS domain-containing nucleotidyltransferase n=1 Tax=Brevundimonas sp. Root1279 TaxID=1736443 RepID=UPI0006F42696|nr:nucleotidyltransferase [Brevundimonas sp. Root1279]KQW82030.1 nucleotidyltransferase [Brevundimonas sp. Root1279]
MSISDSFKSFLSNIAVNNHETIELRYGEITCALNQEFRATQSKTANTLQVGSYGRWTAIKGISDLDMLYIMPVSAWNTYKDGGQYKLLSKVCEAIKARYPKTDVHVDGLVVRVLYADFHIEVQPVFEESDGSFTYPHTANGGSWKTTKPRLEMKAMTESEQQKNRNLRRLCKMARAWKNKHGVAMGGLLIDTLAHNFLKATSTYDETSYAAYDEMVRDFFAFLKDEPEKDYYAALGSGQRVKVKKKFQAKAKKAFELCETAIAARGQAGAHKKWRKVFGRAYPAPNTEIAKAFKSEGGHFARDTEQFIEDLFPVDIRYDLRIDCEVSQKGFRTIRLLEMLAKRFPLLVSKDLTFEIVRNDVPDGHIIYWKVLNRGPEAIRKDIVRGQIVPDTGQRQRSETTSFRGDHVVECYAVLNGVVVATDRIHVPIET